MNKAIIETQHLGRSYGRRRGISNVSLRIVEGQIFGFLGPNGAGKTTTIRILLGFLRPSEGQASIFGLNCWSKSHVIKRDVGYVAGDVRLYPWLTARRGLRIVGSIRHCDVVQYGLELCEQFGLEPDLPLRKMSRGNRQKIALILALAHRPRVVILDEPTSGLDPLMQVVLMRHIQQMAHDGSTILFSSHTLSEVEQVCDHVAMVRAGEIVVDEDLASLKLRAPRTVQVVFQPGTDSSNIRWPNELTPIKLNGTQAELRMIGPSVEFLRWASQQPYFRDIAVGQPALDTLFHEYYDLDG